MTATLVRMGRPKKSEPSEPLRLPASIVRRLRRLGSHLERDAGDIAAEWIVPLLKKAEDKMLADINRERDAKE